MTTVMPWWLSALRQLAFGAIAAGATMALARRFSASGFLDVSTRMDGNQISLVWAETGGPPITDEPVLKGFGSRLISQVSRSMQGSARLDYDRGGLSCRIVPTPAS